MFTGERLGIREADLELVGTGDPPETVLMAWSEGAGCWYGLLDTLIDWSTDAGMSIDATAPFRVDGEEKAPAVYFVESDRAIPWDDFTARMDDFEQRRSAPPPSDAEVAGPSAAARSRPCAP